MARDLDAAIAVTRFGLGAKPGEIAQALPDPRGWLRAQVQPEGADQPPGTWPNAQDRYAALRDYRDKYQALRMDAKVDAAQPPAATMPATMTTALADPAAMAAGRAPVNDVMMRRRELVQPLHLETGAEILGRFQLAAATSAPFRERWALFWSNHFTVAGKSEEAVGAGPGVRARGDPPLRVRPLRGPSRRLYNPSRHAGLSRPGALDRAEQPRDRTGDGARRQAAGRPEREPGARGAGAAHRGRRRRLHPGRRDRVRPRASPAIPSAPAAGRRTANWAPASSARSSTSPACAPSWARPIAKTTPRRPARSWPTSPPARRRRDVWRGRSPPTSSPIRRPPRSSAGWRRPLCARTATSPRWRRR